ncbi:MAG: ribosome biogenesis GTP-binding protein YihA/YsxC [Tissierellia bacterium]|nr:ribosome biogenesis GTP-binding protein YihA/YsxC [Tissierellia bacterium]
MKIKSAELETMAVSPKTYPNDDLPEIALAGRSNVGKSSFINSLVNRRKLAYTSSKPGKTRTVNFYNINNQFRFVDLPGYGYAQVSKSSRRDWADIINKYLETRTNLKEIILLTDIRHEPTKLDCEMYEYILAAGFSGYVIFTKADKISKGKYQRHKNISIKKLGVKNPSLATVYSSENKFNREKVWEDIEKIINEK